MAQMPADGGEFFAVGLDRYCKYPCVSVFICGYKFMSHGWAQMATDEEGRP